MAPLVGASQGEVVVMETLTANLHLLMASFYRPTKEKYKIILEGKAFPSDHVGIFATATNLPVDFTLTGPFSMPWNPKSDIMILIRNML